MISNDVLTNIQSRIAELKRYVDVETKSKNWMSERESWNEETMMEEDIEGVTR